MKYEVSFINAISCTDIEKWMSGIPRYVLILAQLDFATIFNVYDISTDFFEV